MIEAKKFKNPFPGLRPFETDEYRLFFGREGQSDALITRLERSRLLAVVGTSGSGKSSLVRAGLLPALRGGMMAGAGAGWRIATMRPGSDPFSNLAGALADKDVLPRAGGGLPPAEAKAVIEATLRRGSLGLVDAVSQGHLNEHEKLLIVVDQFEELFRFRAARTTTSTGDDASAFVKLLLEAANQRQHSIYIVLTMRSDFLGDCAQFQGLPEAINDGQYLIPRMSRDERRIAITGPIGVARGRIAEPLVSRLLNDVGDNPDQLPILQHALMRTWDYWTAHRRNSEPLGLEHYQAIGTMARALSVHADEAYEILDDRSKRIAELLFKCLSERGADNREIRRPTRISEICDITGNRFEEVSAVIEVFRYEGCSFLMPPEGVPLTPDTVIDISHESLIRNWRRLQKWVDEEAISSRIYRRLAEAAALHREGSEGLLKNPALQIALDWREQHKPNAAWARRYNPEFAEAMEFLDASTAAHEVEIAAQERQREEQLARDRRELEMTRDFAEKQTRAAARMKRLSFALVLILMLAIGTAVFALNARADAERSKGEAQQSARDATAANQKLQLSIMELEKAKGVADTQRQIAEHNERMTAKANEKTKDALDLARKEAERANTQAAIAAKNLRDTQEATTAASSVVRRTIPIVSFGHLLREGTEASRRGKFPEALGFFEKLRKGLEELRPAENTAAKPNLTIEELREFASQIGKLEQFSLDLGWTLSNIGAVHQKQGAFEKAADSYEKALVILAQALPKDSNDPILFETYDGLAHSYHSLAKQGSSDSGKQPPEKSGVEENFRKAEDFFRRALTFQEQHGPDEPAEAATGYLKVARLYVDYRRFDDAEKNFKRGIELRWLGKKSNELNRDERAVLASAFRELGEFYQQKGRYGDAIDVFNKMITVQEDVYVGDLVNQGHEIAISYSDLGQIHAAVSDAAKRDAEKAEDPDSKKKAEKEVALHSRNAENALRVANLLQRVALRLRQMEKLPPLEDQSDVTMEPAADLEVTLVKNLTADLDELGDAYAALGKKNDAAAIYETALSYRGGSDELWKSYDKLTKFYRENENYRKAEDYNNRLIELFKDRSNINRYVDAMIQLASLYARDLNRYSEAESVYKQALDIYAAEDDWQYPNFILYRLGELYLKHKKLPEREQAVRRRLEVLTKYFNRLLARTTPKPKSQITLVTEYLNAVEAAAIVYEKEKRYAEAEAGYRHAFEAYDQITGTIYNSRVLKAYAENLDKYHKLLNKLNKQTEAAKVAALQKKLCLFEQDSEQTATTTGRCTSYR